MKQTDAQRGKGAGIGPAKYLALKRELAALGFSNEIHWSETVKPPTRPRAFFDEYGWVVISAGLKNQVARIIWERVTRALDKGIPIEQVFRHKSKTEAINAVWKNYWHRFDEYQKAKDKLKYLESLPWIGPITKYHLARNLGLDFYKPDRHLVRIASQNGTTPEELCSTLAEETGDRIGTVDYVLWRAANLKML